MKARSSRPLFPRHDRAAFPAQGATFYTPAPSVGLGSTKPAEREHVVVAVLLMMRGFVRSVRMIAIDFTIELHKNRITLELLDKDLSLFFSSSRRVWDEEMWRTVPSFFGSGLGVFFVGRKKWNLSIR